MNKKDTLNIKLILAEPLDNLYTADSIAWMPKELIHVTAPADRRQFDDDEDDFDDDFDEDDLDEDDEDLFDDEDDFDDDFDEDDLDEDDDLYAR